MVGTDEGSGSASADTEPAFTGAGAASGWGALAGGSSLTTGTAEAENESNPKSLKASATVSCTGCIAVAAGAACFAGEIEESGTCAAAAARTTVYA